LEDTRRFCPIAKSADSLGYLHAVSESEKEHPIVFRDDVTVELVKASANDADVIWAARVSTAGEKSLAEIDGDPARSAGLINYLARERHGSPFEHTSMTFFISAPIFVFREFMRHRIASYNEESGRYRELLPVFYIPNKERKLVQIGKTGAYEFIDGTDEQYEVLVAAMKESYVKSYEGYRKMLEVGIAREASRFAPHERVHTSRAIRSARSRWLRRRWRRISPRSCR